MSPEDRQALYERTDPDTMLLRLNHAAITYNLLEAKAAAVVLDSWIRHDGPPPRGCTPERTLDRCREVDEWADRMLAPVDRGDLRQRGA